MRRGKKLFQINNLLTPLLVNNLNTDDHVNVAMSNDKIYNPNMFIEKVEISNIY
jgi:hypothetical protein